jgi:hypothetical protein
MLADSLEPVIRRNGNGLNQRPVHPVSQCLAIAVEVPDRRKIRTKGMPFLLGFACEPSKLDNSGLFDVFLALISFAPLLVFLHYCQPSPLAL